MTEKLMPAYLCVDCEHHQLVGRTRHTCRVAVTEKLCLITGSRTELGVRDCLVERNSYQSFCRPEGRLWKQRADPKPPEQDDRSAEVASVLVNVFLIAMVVCVAIAVYVLNK